MAVNQVQIRRDSYANLYAATPNDGEIAYDQGNKRLTIGDGSKLGGHPIPSWQDIQGNTFTSGTTTGSANAQVLTPGVQYQPTAYATNQRFQFIAGYTNTGTATLTVTGLAAKTIKKISAGALINLAAGDITATLPYEVAYDGTDFVLMNTSGLADGTVTNASLEVAASGDFITAMQWSNDDTNIGSAGVYTKILEIKAPRTGTYNVRINHRITGNGTDYARIYVDGIAAGTERTVWGWYNEDIAVTAGDLVQYYGKAASGSFTVYNTGSYSSLHDALLGGGLSLLALMELDPISNGANYNYEPGMT